MEEIKQTIEELRKGIKDAEEKMTDFQNRLYKMEEVLYEERTQHKYFQSEVKKAFNSSNAENDRTEGITKNQKFEKQLAIEEEDQSKNPQMKVQCQERNSTEYIWWLTDFLKKLQDLRNNKHGEFSSEVFTTNDYGLKMRANLCFNDPYEYISVFIGFVKDGIDLHSAPAIYYHKRTVILCDQYENKQDIVRIYEPGFGKHDAEMWMKGFYGWWWFAPMKLLLKNDQYIKNDNVIIKILLEPLDILYRQLSSNVGVLFWKLENYKHSKDNEVNEILECTRSEYFYSSKKGYRMQIRLHLNGWKENKGRYISMFLWFQKGQFDDVIPERFHYQMTCSILDQSISFTKNDIVKSTERLDENLRIGYGFPDFALQTEIENAVYLRNDSLLLKVQVKEL